MTDNSNESLNEKAREKLRQKMTPEVAEREIDDMFEFFGADTSDEDHKKNKKRLIRGFCDGRINFNIDTEKIEIKLISPIVSDNGDTISSLTLSEPTADQLIAMDKFEERETMKKAIAMTSRITGHADAIIKRLKSRDLMTVSAVVVIFF